MVYSTSGPLIRTKYQNRETGERTAELRANLYVEGDLDVKGEITQNGEPLESGGSTYKVYTALLSQSGTGAPTATVLENTLGGTVEWARTGVGRYTATLTNAFLTGKTFVLVSANAVVLSTSPMAYQLTSNSVITLRTMDDTFTLADDRMANTSIEIRVY